MAERKIVVPEGMLKAFHLAENHEGLKWDEKVLDKMLEAALRWLSENPIKWNKKWTPQGLTDIGIGDNISVGNQSLVSIVEQCFDRGQRLMFLAPKEEIPEEIKDLLANAELNEYHPVERSKVEKLASEAFLRGKHSR